jgi:hypothetical protein
MVTKPRLADAEAKLSNSLNEGPWSFKVVAADAARLARKRGDITPSEHAALKAGWKAKYGSLDNLLLVKENGTWVPETLSIRMI